MTYEHYVYTTTPESVAAAYQQAAFIAEAHEGLVMVYTDYDEAIREKVERIASEQGADYDGGGMYLGPVKHLSPGRSANRAIRYMSDVGKSPQQLAEELARLRRDNQMLTRQLAALLTTDLGALATRNDELSSENADLKAKLAALGVTV